MEGDDAGNPPAGGDEMPDIGQNDTREWTEYTGDWKDIGAFSLYAGDWASGKLSYKGGESLDDFILRIDNSTYQAWGLQLRTKSFETEVEKNYKFVVEYTTDNDEGNPVLTKLEPSEESNLIEIDYKLKYGNNSVEIPFTAKEEQANVVFNLSYVKIGTTFKFNKVELVPVEGDASDEEPPAVTDPDGDDDDDGEDGE